MSLVAANGDASGQLKLPASAICIVRSCHVLPSSVPPLPRHEITPDGYSVLIIPDERSAVDISRSYVCDASRKIDPHVMRTTYVERVTSFL
jgi:hypothetical protein